VLFLELAQGLEKISDELIDEDSRGRDEEERKTFQILKKPPVETIIGVIDIFVWVHVGKISKIVANNGPWCKNISFSFAIAS
jgi:hypothetical protein